MRFGSERKRPKSDTNLQVNNFCQQLLMAKKPGKFEELKELYETWIYEDEAKIRQQFESKANVETNNGDLVSRYREKPKGLSKT